MFYRIDKDGNILDMSDFKYAEDCIETDKNIIRGFDGNLIFEEEMSNDDYKRLEADYIAQQNLRAEYIELNRWFEEYDNQVKQYSRCVRLGLEFDKNINELDNQAKISAERITEIRQLLNQNKE